MGNLDYYVAFLCLCITCLISYPYRCCTIVHVAIIYVCLLLSSHILVSMQVVYCVHTATISGFRLSKIYSGTKFTEGMPYEKVPIYIGKVMTIIMVQYERDS